MKLRNKLIPLLSATSVAVTLAPVALTSCGNSMTNLMRGYNPSIKKAVWEDYLSTKKDMLPFYASAVNENPAIFEQDLLWNTAMAYWYQIDSAKTEGLQITPTIMEAKVSNIAIRQCNCQYLDETKAKKEVKYYTISFDYAFHFAYTQEGQSASIKNELTSNLSIKNIPFTLNRNNTWTQDINVTNDDTWYGWMTEINPCFHSGCESTDWVLQPLVGINWNSEYSEFNQIDYTAFTRIESNGFEWFIKYNNTVKTTTTPYGSNEPETETSNTKMVFDHASQFAKALKYTDSLETICVIALYEWFVPSYYLSDIKDELQQLWDPYIYE